MSKLRKLPALPSGCRIIHNNADHGCREKKEKRDRRTSKRPRSDAEKIAEAERRAAVAGKLTGAAQLGLLWAAGQQQAPSDGFYIDTHGDQGNLAFDGLYRANLAAYSRLDPTGIAKGTKARHGYAYGPRWRAFTCPPPSEHGYMLPPSTQ